MKDKGLAPLARRTGEGQGVRGLMRSLGFVRSFLFDNAFRTAPALLPPPSPLK